MNEPFTHIATVLFQHQYFDEGSFQSLECSVTSNSQVIMRNLGLLSKPFKGGVHILASEVSLLKALSEDYPVHIELRCNDTYYINYTQLPVFQLSSDCLCFHNLNAIQMDEAAVLRLHKEAFVGSNEVMQVCNGVVTLRSFDPLASYTFTNASGTQLPAPYVQQPDPSKNQFLVKDIAEGILYVYENNVRKESENIYYQPDGFWNKPLGVLELYPSTLHDHYLENEGAITYSVKFEARKTVRKYFIVQNSNPPYKKLTIIDGSRKELFDRDQDAIGNLSFTARTSYPLSNSPNLPLQLVNNFIPDKRKEKVVVKHLAHPSPSHLYLDESPTSTIMYSHMYVYI
jgi:hypothetical protein